MAKDPRKDVIKEVNKIIDDAGVENADLLKKSLKLMGTCPCYGEGTVVEKKKRAPTERSIFMGNCMRSVGKGGEGKDMASCSTKWKELKEDKK